MIRGIDISEHQGAVDFQRVKSAGVTFVIPREGYRNTIDRWFLRYVSGAKEAGLQILGVYHFIYTDGATIRENAESTYQDVLGAGLDPKETWIFADLEDDTFTKNGLEPTKARCTNILYEYLDVLRDLGCKKLGIYTNNWYYSNLIDWDVLADYKDAVWLADYSDGPDQPCMIQQTSEDGIVDGIYGTVDTDVYFGEVDDMPDRNSIIESATKWMETLANDNSHGYDQIYRWGEKGDYDCSSAVITAWQQAGVPVKAAGATYTGNMTAPFVSNGFEDVTGLVNLATGSGLQRGDVLLNVRHHVAMYIGNGKEVEASINEKGTATGGQPGDQTGREILIRSYRNYPWDKVLRYTGGQTSRITTTVKRGMTGGAVTVLQQMLVKLGYSIAIDGDFGPATEKAVKGFQTVHGLEVDGIVGKMTWSKLYDLTEIKAATPSQTPKWIGSIVPPPLMVRTDPDPDADMLSTYPYLGYGNLVDVCDELTGKDGKRWYFVRIAGKHFGYVPGDCVETVT